MNRAIVKGILACKKKSDEFIGTIEFEERDNGIYLTWKLKSLQDEFLAMKGFLISKNIIPPDINALDYSLSSAIESINTYRILRKRAFNVKEYNWES
jgi:hypothetical protein